MATKVVNIKTDNYDVYIGRGSKFGNPYSHLPLRYTKAQVQVKTRDESIERYREYFYKQIEEDPEFLDDILRLKNKTLGCHCAPINGFNGKIMCHGQIISEFLDVVLQENIIV